MIFCWDVLDEVQGAGDAMNKGYRPIPPPYNPNGGNEPLIVRERMIEARKAYHDTLLALQLEVKSAGNNRFPFHKANEKTEIFV